MTDERLTIVAVGQKSGGGDYRVTISHSNDAGSRLYTLRVGDSVPLPAAEPGER